MEALQILNRNEMKHIMAGGYACTYYVSGSWTGKLTGCSTTTTSGTISGSPAGVGAEASISVSEETCCYEAYDPYGMGYTGEECINGAVARQC